MKPKYPFHLAILGIPFLLLSSAADAENRETDRKAAEAAETGELEKEKGKARRATEAAESARGNAERAEEAAERAKEAAETGKTEHAKAEAKRAKETAERAKEAAQRAEQAADRATETAEKAIETAERATKDTEENEPVPGGKIAPIPEKPAVPDRDRERGETAPDAAENPETQAAPERGEGRERPARPTRPIAPPVDKNKPPIDMPVIPTEPLRPRETDVEPANEKPPERDRDKPAEREMTETPTNEPERLAETEVTEVTREVLRELDQRKTRIEGREQAEALIDDILGAESRIFRAEIAREERFRSRLERQHQSEDRFTEVSPDQRREATSYLQERLRGREVQGPPPEFFGRSQLRGDRREPRVVERVEIVRPRYLNEGRRYVHFDSRAAIPAILMAAQAMNHVRFQPTREIAPIFYERQDSHAMPLPPESYRGESSWVVSYPVDENSMISSEDILFLQGSTQFSDPYPYEVVGALAAAMKELPEEERFVIEGHASAEGGYDSNMILSQQRAEYIVREIVRRGVSPYRLLPVGYGESEARHPANAAEPLRSQDRRVVVFRMKPEPISRR